MHVFAMDRSIPRSPDPAPVAPHGERRRCIRHKLHSPVFASFNGPQTGMVLDLSELLDLHEEGFALQTSQELEVGRALNLCLDLPETKAFVHASGHVVWSDASGRGGIQFSGLPDDARRLLKEWLFINLLIGCTHQAARARQRAERVREEPPEPTAVQEAPAPAPVVDITGMLSAVDAVRREVRAAGNDLDAVLPLITERALSLTGASGAALAYLTGDKMICRARAGELAPRLGTPVDVKQGLSGECARSGRMVVCEDIGSDPRVDQELCRALGIGSILASPIVSDFRVVGLLEVFSPCPRAFTKVHGTVLDRLVEIIPKAPPETPLRQDPATGALVSSSVRPEPSVHTIRDALGEPEAVAPEPLKGSLARRLHLGVLILAVILATVGLGRLLVPTVERRWLKNPDSPAASQTAVPAVSLQNPAPSGGGKKTPEDLRRLAEQGDADAQWNMGVLYHTGEGVPQDDAQAVQWFERAAEQGHLPAQASLGAYYWAGRGVPRDLSKAYFWSLLALTQGDESMKSRLEPLASQMTRSQVLAARQQAEEWIREHARKARPDAK